MKHVELTSEELHRLRQLDATGATRPWIAGTESERDAMAAAWDEGHEAGHEDARAVQSTYPEPTPNPYRAEGEPHA